MAVLVTDVNDRLVIIVFSLEPLVRRGCLEALFPYLHIQCMYQ